MDDPLPAILPSPDMTEGYSDPLGLLQKGACLLPGDFPPPSPPEKDACLLPGDFPPPSPPEKDACLLPGDVPLPSSSPILQPKKGEKIAFDILSFFTEEESKLPNGTSAPPHSVKLPPFFTEEESRLPKGTIASLVARETNTPEEGTFIPTCEKPSISSRCVFSNESPYISSESDDEMKGGYFTTQPAEGVHKALPYHFCSDSNSSDDEEKPNPKTTSPRSIASPQSLVPVATDAGELSSSNLSPSERPSERPRLRKRRRRSASSEEVDAASNKRYRVEVDQEANKTPSTVVDNRDDSTDTEVKEVKEVKNKKKNKKTVLRKNEFTKDYRLYRAYYTLTPPIHGANGLGFEPPPVDDVPRVQKLFEGIGKNKPVRFLDDIDPERKVLDLDSKAKKAKKADVSQGPVKLVELKSPGDIYSINTGDLAALVGKIWGNHGSISGTMEKDPPGVYNNFPSARDRRGAKTADVLGAPSHLNHRQVHKLVIVPPEFARYFLFLFATGKLFLTHPEEGVILVCFWMENFHSKEAVEDNIWGLFCIQSPLGVNKKIPVQPRIITWAACCTPFLDLNNYGKVEDGEWKEYLPPPWSKYKFNPPEGTWLIPRNQLS
jgi:hypothetical protein